MKEIAQKRVESLNTQIQELELIDNENKQFIKEASENKNISQSEVDERMLLAKKQQEELKMLKVWKKYYQTTYLN